LAVIKIPPRIRRTIAFARGSGSIEPELLWIQISNSNFAERSLRMDKAAKHERKKASNKTESSLRFAP
jgi:hypothetical protein